MYWCADGYSKPSLTSDEAVSHSLVCISGKRTRNGASRAKCCRAQGAFAVNESGREAPAVLPGCSFTDPFKAGGCQDTLLSGLVSHERVSAHRITPAPFSRSAIRSGRTWNPQTMIVFSKATGHGQHRNKEVSNGGEVDRRHWQHVQLYDNVIAMKGFPMSPTPYTSQSFRTFHAQSFKCL